jgi:choline dehydrogenase-like flavoprotein
MIRDALSEPNTDLVQADICIIGAGAAGITLGLALADTRLSVCILESGGFELDAITQSLYGGQIVGLDYFALDATRLRYFGGTTGHWGGMCGPLQPIDFRSAGGR